MSIYTIHPVCNNFTVFQRFQMSLFASLDMTAYQVRVMFLDRLRDEYETTELKVAILEFVATCVGTQPGLTEAFFMMNHDHKMDTEEDGKDKTTVEKKPESDDSFEGILGYMADYLGTVKSVSMIFELAKLLLFYFGNTLLDI